MPEFRINWQADGWLVEGADPDRTDGSTSGMLIAHDILEHVNGPEAIGSIEDELEALGAVAFTRANFIPVTIAHDMEYLSEQSEYLLPVQPEPETDEDEYFFSQIELAEVDGQLIHYLRRGYAKAVARFDGQALWAYDLHHEIANLIDDESDPGFDYILTTDYKDVISYVRSV